MITAPSVKEISEGSRWWCGRWGGQGKHRSGRVFLRTWSGLTELTSQSTAKEACSDKFESNQEHKTELETSITLREIPKQLLLQFLDVNIGKIKKKKKDTNLELCVSGLSLHEAINNMSLNIQGQLSFSFLNIGTWNMLCHFQVSALFR